MLFSLKIKEKVWQKRTVDKRSTVLCALVPWCETIREECFVNIWMLQSTSVVRRKCTLYLAVLEQREMSREQVAKYA
jgi:hypothetical protein